MPANTATKPQERSSWVFQPQSSFKPAKEDQSSRVRGPDEESPIHNHEKSDPHAPHVDLARNRNKREEAPPEASKWEGALNS